MTTEESRRLIELLGGPVQAELQAEVDYLNSQGIIVHLAYYWQWAGSKKRHPLAWIPREQLPDAQRLGYRGLIFLQDNEWARIHLRGESFVPPSAN